MKGRKWDFSSRILTLALLQILVIPFYLVTPVMAADIVNTTDIGTALVPAAGDGINESGDNNITNNADIYVEEVGIATESGTITNNGVVSSEYNVAILTGDSADSFTNSDGATVVVVNSATFGIGLGDDSDTLTNAGVIDIATTSCSSISFGNELVGDDTFINSGSVTIENNEGWGAIAFCSGDDTLENSGNITIEYSSWGGITFGSGEDELVNDGLIRIEEADSGAGISMGSDNDVLTNTGTIMILDANTGISLAYGDDTFTNNDYLLIGETVQAGISTGPGEDVFTNTGEITLQDIGSSAISMGSGDDTFTNSGVINVESADSAGINLGEENDSFTNSATGVITILDASTGISLGSGVDTFDNAGEIYILSADPHGINMGDGGYVDGVTDYLGDTFTNSGLIDIAYASNHGIKFGTGDDTMTNTLTGVINIDDVDTHAIHMADGDDTLDNAGTINIGIVNNHAIFLADGDDSLINSGTIEIDFANNNAIRLADGDDTLTNTGDIIIHGSGSSAINLSDGDDTLTNSGLIEINVSDGPGITLGSGDDTLTNEADGVIQVDYADEEAIMLSAGNDVLTNAGLIDIGAANSAGISLTSGDGTVTNTGDILIRSVDGEGIYLGGEESVYNSTTYVTTYFYNSTLLLENSGTIDIGSTNSSGIYLEEGLSNTVDNQATGEILIDNVQYHGLYLESRSSDYNSANLLTNAGTIDIGLTCSNGIYLENAVTNTIDNQAGASIYIDATIDGGGIVMEGSTSYNSVNTLTNAGLIDIGTTNSNGIYMEDASNVLTNTGEIVLRNITENGIYLDTHSPQEDSYNQLTNSGTIDMLFVNSNGIELYQGVTQTLTNEAGGVMNFDALGEYGAIVMDANSNSTYNSTNLLTNAGLIDIGFSCEEGVEMEAEFSNTFNNSGEFLLDGTLADAINLDVSSSEYNSTNLLTNTGVIDIGFANSSGIYLEGGVIQSVDNQAGATITMDNVGLDGYTAIELEASNSYNSTNLLTNAGLIDIGYTNNGIVMESASNTLINSGNIEIDYALDRGIYLDANESYTQSNILTNSGDITIGAAFGEAIELEDGVLNKIDNQAGASIVVGPVVDDDAIRLYGDANDPNEHVLINAGTIDIASACNGILMYYGDSYLDNDGTITIDTAYEYGIYVYAYDSVDQTRNDVVLENDGTIEIGSAADTYLYLQNGEMVTLANGADGIITLGDSPEGGGIDLYAYNTATLTNAGTISIGAVNSTGIEVDGDELATLNNSGTISIESSYEYEGIDVNASDDVELINSGTISIGATCAEGILLEGGIVSGDTATFHNTAEGLIEIETSSDEDYIYIRGYNVAVLNEGTINLTNNAEDDGFYVRYYGQADFDNTGDISIANAADGTALSFYTSTGDEVDFNNEGTITIDVAQYGIDTSAGDDVFTNTGTISITNAEHGIYLGSGDDVLTTSGALNFDSIVEEVLNGGSGHDILNLQGTDALGIEGDIENFEDLYKSGAGSWTLNGDVEAYNSVVVSEGTLIVNGDLDNNYADGVSVASGATFGGDMVVYGDVMVGGTIAPGNSIGTVHIDGADYYQDDGATYEVEVGSFEESDLILVTGGDGGGTAYLHDGALVNVTSVGYVADGDIFTILQADTLDSFYNAAGLSYSSIVLDYEYVDDEDDTVKLAATRTPYEELVSSNAAGAGNALIDLADNGDLDAAAALGQVDNSGNTDDLEDGLGSLAPEMYPELVDFSSRELHTTALMGYMTNMHVASNFKSQADVASNKMTAAGPALSRMAAFDDRESGISGWARLVGTSGSQDKDGDLQGYDFDTYGLSVGFDNKVSSNLLLGLGFGMASSDVDFDNYSQSTDVDGYFGSFYGSYATGNIYVDAALSYASNDYDSDRYVTLADAKASSSTDGTELGLYVGGGLTMVNTETMYFVPTASLSWATVDIDGFTENGATPFNLDVDDYDADSLVATLGFRWGGKMGMMEPELRLAWAHEFGDTDRDVTARFDGTTTTFTIDGVEPDEDSALIGLGADFFVGENMTIYLDYDGEFRSDFDAHSLSGGLRYNF